MTIHKPITKTAAETELAAQFAALVGADATRAAAFARFVQAGLPTKRLEAWHYTDLRSAMLSAAPPAPAPNAAAIKAARQMLASHSRLGATRLVLLDGRYIPALSDPAPKGCLIGALTRSTVLAQPDAVIALNAAFAEGGLSLAIEAGAAIAGRIEILHCASSAGRMITSRIEVKLGAGASAGLLERFCGHTSTNNRNTLILFNLEEKSSCDHVVAVDDGVGLHLESQLAVLGAKAQFNAFALVAGGALVRRQLFVGHAFADASIQLGGLSLLNGRRHADTTIVVDHAAPHGQSREFYKHIVADEATGVYQGKVIVAAGAQKTDGRMKSQAILLSPGAVMNNKPELEILADDVVCGHGATVGALDPEQIFYLQARGIARGEAEAMLLEAFAAEAIERHGDAVLGESLKEITRDWLARRALA